MFVNLDSDTKINLDKVKFIHSSEYVVCFLHHESGLELTYDQCSTLRDDIHEHKYLSDVGSGIIINRNAISYTNKQCTFRMAQNWNWNITKWKISSLTCLMFKRSFKCSSKYLDNIYRTFVSKKKNHENLNVYFIYMVYYNM